MVTHSYPYSTTLGSLSKKMQTSFSHPERYSIKVAHFGLLWVPVLYFFLRLRFFFGGVGMA